VVLRATRRSKASSFLFGFYSALEWRFGNPPANTPFGTLIVTMADPVLGSTLHIFSVPLQQGLEAGGGRFWESTRL